MTTAHKLADLKRLLRLGILIPGIALAFAGCQDSGDEMEDAAEETMDAVDDAADAAADTVEDAADEVDDSY